jgi:hypothetical protein
MQQVTHRWKALLVGLAVVAIFGAGVMTGANKYNKPKTILQMTSIKWKPESTPEQREAAIKAFERMAGEVPGIRNIWIADQRIQPGSGFDKLIALEFENEAALTAYGEHPAHKQWYDVYIPIRAQSSTNRVTN